LLTKLNRNGYYTISIMKNWLFVLLSLLLMVSCDEKQEMTEKNHPAQILLNRLVLERSKNAIQRNDPNVMPAYKALIDKAEGMLSEEPHSVMDKQQTPPSGNKHDYMSMGPYWWPDPSKPDGLPYIRRDGEISPERDLCTDRKYMHRMSDIVQTLGLAYFFSGDERYATHAANWLKIWFLNEATRMNPHLEYGQSIPGICEGRSIGIIDSACLASMLDGVILLKGSQAWNETDDEALQKWVEAFNQWLLTSKFGKEEDDYFNNHGTYFDYQSCVYSIYTGHNEDARKRIDKISRARLDSQLEADGSQPYEMDRTKPWGYSIGNLAGLVDLAVLGDRVGVNLWEHVTPKGASIRKAIEWFFPFIAGEKPFPKEEITQHRDVGGLARVLRQTADRFGVDTYRKQIENLKTFGGDNADLDKSVSVLTHPILDGPILSVEDFFDKLDMSYKGLEQVKKDVELQNYEAAQHDFVTYLKGREMPKWFIDWHDFNKAGNRQPDYDCTQANEIASNLLSSSGTPYQFGDTIDWSINPTEIKYPEWTWQLARHSFWPVLGRAYWATGNEKYARAFVHQIRSWIKFNPVPDHRANEFYSRWRPLEAGIRARGSWPDALAYFLPSSQLDDDTIMLIMRSTYEHGAYLSTQYSQANNHLASEMNGLFCLGVLFPEFKEAAGWCKLSSDRMFAEQQAQFYPDGAQVELAPSYHGVSLSDLMHIFKVAKLNGYKLPKGYEEQMENLYNYYLNIIMPNGNELAVNDSHWGQKRAMLGEAFRYMPHRTDFQYVATEGKEGTEPVFTSVWMPWAGWYVMRSGWDEDALYAHFEVGPFSAAHQHEDKLSIILHAYGNTLLSEGGKYDYDASEQRQYTMSAPAHNVVRVDGKDQLRGVRRSEKQIAFSTEPMTNRWITNERFDFGEGWYTEGFGNKKEEDFHEGWYRGGKDVKLDSAVTQYRALVFLKNKYWLLFDVFTPTDATTHEYTSWFHFDTTDYEIHTDAPYYIQSTEPKDANLAIVPLQGNGIGVKVIIGQEEPELQGWIARAVKGNKGEKYECYPVATAEFTRRAKGQWVEPYLLYPLHDGETLPVKEVTVMDNNTIKIVFTDGLTNMITYSITGNCLNTLSITESGEGKEEQITIF